MKKKDLRRIIKDADAQLAAAQDELSVPPSDPRPGLRAGNDLIANARRILAGGKKIKWKTK